MLMHFNVLFVLTLSALYGQSLGFWPFDIVAGLDTKQHLDSNQADSGAKRIAIIGKCNSCLFLYSSSVFFDALNARWVNSFTTQLRS